MHDDSQSLASDAVIEEHSLRVPRTNVMLLAMIEQTDTGLTTKHRVRNLSSSGLRVDNASGLERGATVMISVGALEAIAATVRWVHEGLAGVAFETPIETEDARQKTAIATSVAATKAIGPSPNPGATAGWVGYLQNPYRR